MKQRKQPARAALHLCLSHMHWSKGMLPGIAKYTRSETNFILFNHAKQHLLSVLDHTEDPIAAIIGGFHQSDTRLMAELRKRQIPFVNIASRDPPPDVPAVLMDNEAVGKMAAEHLLTLGPRTFAFVGLGETPMSEDRFRGFQTAIQTAYPKKSVHVFTRDMRSFLTDLPKPIAVFCATDTRARTVVSNAERLDLDIPGDLAVIGVDNDPFECELSRIPLSSVDVDFAEMGYRAAELANQLYLGEPPPPTPLRIPPRHVEVRLSSDWHPVQDSVVSQALRLIRQPREDPWRVTELAQALGISRRKLEQHFQVNQAGTVFEAIHEARMDRACQLLETTTRKISEIALEVGLKDSKRFTALFRERFGCSPRDFRKKLASDPEKAS